VRKNFLAMLGGLPTERTPLNVRQTGVLKRAGYRVEKLIFESQPGLYVTANLYVPENGRSSHPAILHPTGHSTSAKNRAFYQTLSIGLVKQGFVVLCYDPAGQGERRIFYNAEFEDSIVGSGTVEHSMIGIQSLLAGESVARYMVWDAMRAVDVLESRADVDRSRIGVTGCSGGGTLSVYLAALDPRIRVAAPACYVTSWEDQVGTAGPQDAEQQFPDQLRLGIDHADLVALAAPKPYLIVSSEADFFPLAGAQKTFERARAVWRLYGTEDRIDWFHEPGTHGIYQAGRERVYTWMRRWLMNDATPVNEPEILTEPEYALNTTPTGQLRTSLGGETLSSLNLKRYQKLVPTGTATREKLVRVIRYEAPRLPLDWRTEKREPGVEHLSFDPGDGLRVPARLLMPATSRGGAVLCLNCSSSDLQDFVRDGRAVLAVDVAATGALADRADGYAGQWFGQERVAWLALMTGRPLVGIQVREIVAAVELLSARGLLGPEGLAGVATGNVGVALLHAAVLDGRFASLIVESIPASYRAIAQRPIHRGVFEMVLLGVLTEYDLPDLVAVLAPRPVWLLSTRTPAGAPMLPEALNVEYERARHAYVQAGQADRLHLRLRREKEPLPR
jgi:dienelactone hydrolase